MGQDTGFGFGWTLQAGSLIPVWTPAAQLDHFIFVDSTGAEYSLNVVNSGVWTSQEGTYVAFDQNTNRLYFPDGSFWAFFCQSSAGEEDAGTLYPTNMFDTNGNSIEIYYGWGAGAAGANSTARISGIRDPRGGAGLTYSFNYSTDNSGIPHLTSIANRPRWKALKR